MTDPTLIRLVQEMEEAMYELKAATRRLCDADPQPFTNAMLAVQERERVDRPG